MGSNENNLDNSIESALNMSQEEIEKLLNGYEQSSNDQFNFDGEDLASLLSELEAADEDDDIQEISSLLDKADNNEAVDEGIEELMRKQELEEEIPAYAANDLFSDNEAEIPKKKGLIQRLIERFKKPDTDNVKEDDTSVQENGEMERLIWAEEDAPVEAEVPKKAKKEKKVKEKKRKKKKEETKEAAEQNLDEKDVFQASEDALNGSDAIIFELEKDENANQEELDKIKSKKEKKSKNKKKTKKSEEVPEGENPEENGKKKKEKKQKEKKVKEKRVKIKTVDITDFEETEPVSTKKTMVIFFVCIMLMLAFIAIIVNYSGHANRRLAEEAYEQGDYLECYQMLYGQHMDESQEVMFHKSEIRLRMDLLWNRYESYKAQGELLQSLDKLVQFVFEYPELAEYAATWNCGEVVEQTRINVLNELYEEYRLEEQDALNIANIESDIDYTKELADLVEKKEAGMLKYPNMLPEEEERIIQTGE